MRALDELATIVWEHHASLEPLRLAPEEFKAITECRMDRANGRRKETWNDDFRAFLDLHRPPVTTYPSIKVTISA